MIAMSLAQIAYLFKPHKDEFVSCVVTDKNLIKNAKEGQFEEIRLFISKEDIRQWNEALNMNQENEDEFEDDY